MSIAQTDKSTQSERIVPLKPSLYSPTSDELEVLKKWTGIDDEAELKEHVLVVQREAWNVKPYRCILIFGFISFNLSRHPRYQYLLTLRKSRPNSIFLDFGCCFGSDVRKAITDGYPAENIVTSDIEQEFWDLGHKLFRTKPETFPVRFVHGDIFDATHVALTEPLYTPPSARPPTLSTLTSLNPLRGHVSAIHTSLFFHLFGKSQQVTAAKAIASLLSPEPGSIIFGMHSSKATSGTHVNLRGVDVYDFSPGDWKALWDGEIFEAGTVEVEAELRDKAMRPGLTEEYRGENPTLLVWSVMRK